MTFNLHPTQIPFTITKSKEKSYTLQLQWFHENTQALQDIINYYETKQNQMRKHILPDLIAKIEQYYTMPAEKHALQQALALYYPFKEQDPLHHKYPLKGTYLPLIKKATDLRIEFFSMHSHYTPPKNHRQTLTPLATQFNTTPAHLKRALYSTYKPNHILTKQSTPTPSQLIGHINYAYITNLAKLSTQITIILPPPNQIPSNILKQTIMHAKKTLIWVDIRTKNNQTIMTMQQLDETLHKTKEINTQLAQTLKTMLTITIQTNTPFTLIMDLKAKAKIRATFKIQHHQLQDLYIPQALQYTKPSTFDSKIETKFNDLLSKTPSHWEFTPQPLIIQPDLIYIPDFIATHKQDKKPILIEIAGYYTKQYLTKKQAKLKKLQTKYDLIIITPKENKQWFTSIHNATIITYNPNKPLPYQRIFHALNTKYAPKTSPQQIIELLNTLPPPITINELITAHSTTLPQLHAIMTTPKIQQYLRSHHLTYIPKCCILTQSNVKTIHESLTPQFNQNDSPPTLESIQSILQQILPNKLHQFISQILTTLGYKLEYKDLTSIYVKSPY